MNQKILIQEVEALAAPFGYASTSTYEVTEIALITSINFEF